MKERDMEIKKEGSNIESWCERMKEK